MSKQDSKEAEKIFSGEKIYKLRNQRKLTRQQIHKLTKIPPRTLEDWEYGNTIPTKLSSLRLLAETLDCTLQDFCYDGIVLDPNYKNYNNLLNNEDITFIISLLNDSLKTCDDETKRIHIKNIVDKLS